MFRLVFWWSMCVPVIFSFSYLNLVLYLGFSFLFFFLECFLYSNVRLLHLFINFINAQSVSFTRF